MKSIPATIEGWLYAGLSPADMDAVAQGIVEDVESNSPYLSHRDMMIRCAKLGIIYRQCKENEMAQL